MNNDNRHWTDNDLLDRLYGLDPAPGLTPAHLDTCPGCGVRWQALENRRAAVVAPAPPSPDVEQRLRAQRQTIFARIEHPRRALLWRAVPAGAAAFMLFAGIALHQPVPLTPRTEVAAVSVSDEQLFTEIASVVNRDTPRAADNIRGLFSESSSQEAQ
jgi:hypothetical protein